MVRRLPVYRRARRGDFSGDLPHRHVSQAPSQPGALGRGRRGRAADPGFSHAVLAPARSCGGDPCAEPTGHDQPAHGLDRLGYSIHPLDDGLGRALRDPLCARDAPAHENPGAQEHPQLVHRGQDRRRGGTSPQVLRLARGRQRGGRRRLHGPGVAVLPRRGPVGESGGTVTVHRFRLLHRHGLPAADHVHHPPRGGGRSHPGAL